MTGFIFGAKTTPLRRFHLFARPGAMSLCEEVSWVEVTPEKGYPYPKPWVCAGCVVVAEAQGVG